jgi:hypothetical protein
VTVGVGDAGDAAGAGDPLEQAAAATTNNSKKATREARI